MQQRLPLILASQSPRRASLLQQLGVQFTQLSGDLDETPIANETMSDYVQRLARGKAEFIQQRYAPSKWILGADTIGIIDQQLLTKPVDQADAQRMWRLMSGRTHQVLTSVALVNGEQCWQQTITTKVTFCHLTDDDMLTYWQTGEPQDKAGAYAIQGLGGQFVTRLDGSYSAVVGLPLYETKCLLQQAGVMA